MIGSGNPTVLENNLEPKTGPTRRLRTKRVLIDHMQRDPFILGIADDVTDRHLAHEKIAHLAMHDPLTGLRNRTGIAGDFESLMAPPCAQETAVLALDLDRFKGINDLHGHPVGDEVLLMFAERIEALAPDGSFAGRIGGDEFILLLGDRDAGHRAARFATELLESLAEPFILEDQSIYVDASLGIAISGKDGDDFEVLSQSADRALYRAKREGRGRFCFFDPSMDKAVTVRRALENDLREAIATDQITLCFQPLTSLEDDAVEGFEALARWDHPERGEITPDTLIAIAEESGMITQLGERVLDMAIGEAASWDQPLRVAVNLSPAQFRDENLVQVIIAALQRHELDPQRLELEVTENSLMQDTARAIRTLKELQAIGVKVAMDDFGTGYSSLSYLRMFPFDKVKIDRTFVHDMIENPQSMAIVQAIIGLGQGLQLKIVAEGVETDEQIASLRAQGCSVAQGFGVGKPQPIENFYGSLVNQRKPGTSTARATRGEETRDSHAA